MLLIKIPDWANYIKIEFDNTIHAHRYLPNSKENKGDKYEIIGSVTGGLKVGTITLPLILENNSRFMNDQLIITDKTGRDYKELTLEIFLKQNS